MNRKSSNVIIGRNAGEPLGPVEATVPLEGGHETIYVDSASTDNSFAIAQSFGARVMDFDPERPTAAKAHNSGNLCALNGFYFSTEIQLSTRISRGWL
jgi:hypothetical protein